MPDLSNRPQRTVKFYTQPGCVPCAAFKPHVKNAADAAGHVFVEQNVREMSEDDLNNAAVMATPTVVIFEGEQETGRFFPPLRLPQVLAAVRG